MNDFISDEAGFSLLEVIIAIAIAGIIASAGTDLLYSAAHVSNRIAQERTVFSDYPSLRAKLRNAAAGVGHASRTEAEPENRLSVEIRTLTKSGIIETVPYSISEPGHAPARHPALEPQDVPRLMVLHRQNQGSGTVENMLPDLFIRIPRQIHGPGL